MILSCCFHNNDVWRNIFQISYKSINPPVSVNLLMYRFFWIVKAIKRILRNVNPNNTSPFYCSSHPCKYGLYAQATVRECHEMSGDLDFSASFELRPRIDLPLMLGPPLRGEVEFSHMTKDFFEWQYTRPRIVPYGTSSPYGLLPRNQGTASPFCLPLCIPERGRARGGQQCRITGKFSYVAMVPRRAHTMELWNMKTYLCFMKKGHFSLYSFLLTKRSIF